MNLKRNFEKETNGISKNEIRKRPMGVNYEFGRNITNPAPLLDVHFATASLFYPQILRLVQRFWAVLKSRNVPREFSGFGTGKFGIFSATTWGGELKFRPQVCNTVREGAKELRDPQIPPRLRKRNPNKNSREESQIKEGLRP